MCIVVDYDPWLFGAILLGILLFLALLGLLAALLYIICYKREDKVIIETLPAVTEPLHLLVISSALLLIACDSDVLVTNTTSSSAVAKKPRDAASCLPVVSFNSTKRRARSFIVSYIRYRFITACN